MQPLPPKNQPMQKVNYLLTAQEAQRIKMLVATEIKKFQQRIIELESENCMLKEQLGLTGDESSNSSEENVQPNPIAW